MYKKLLTTISLVLLLLGQCACEKKPTLKVAASAVPHAEILEFIKPELKNQGIDLEIITTDDYQMPNRALAAGEVDANFFQHIPFMQHQIAEFHYPIESIAKIEIEPMGLYSKKISTLSDLTAGSTVAIPNDPSNGSRALLLLASKGIVTLKNAKAELQTLQDIASNPQNLKFIEIDAAMLTRTLEEVELSVINANYALQTNLSPQHDALALEDQNSPYANVLVVRINDGNRQDIQALKAAMTSEKTRQFIINKYKGAVMPEF